MTHPILWQGWPLSLGQMDGRTIRDVGKISVNSRMSMAELKGLFRQPPLSPGSVRPLLAGTGFTPSVPCGAGVLPEMSLSLVCDDCESVSLLARQAKQALLSFFWRVSAHSALQAGSSSEYVTGLTDAIMREFNDWHVFNNFSAVSWQLMSRFVYRLGSMLRDGQLRVMTGVGLATNASKAEEESNRAQYCGHCFNVGLVKTPGMDIGVPFLLEGTAAMYAIPVDQNSPRVTVSMIDGETGETTGETKVMDMPSFLSALSGTLMSLSAVINRPNGGMSGDVGWPMDLEVRGWLGKTNVIPSLTSEPGTHLPFYSRIMYMGWPCTTDGHGCMPVEGKTRDDITAGCHPFHLTQVDVKGVDATLDQEASRIMADVMEEAVPPQAPREAVREIVRRWIKCRPLEVVNREAGLLRQAGVKYHRVVCMESPCAPEYLSIIHEAKCRLADETNRINDLREDSDGIRLYALLEGMDSLLCADVKDVEIKKLTIVESMKHAAVNIAWPRSWNSKTG